MGSGSAALCQPRLRGSIAFARVPAHDDDVDTTTKLFKSAEQVSNTLSIAWFILPILERSGVNVRAHPRQSTSRSDLLLPKRDAYPIRLLGRPVLAR